MVTFPIFQQGLSQCPSMEGLRALALILALYHCLPHGIFWLLASQLKVQFKSIYPIHQPFCKYGTRGEFK
jgi:hypothetical protein